MLLENSVKGSRRTEPLPLPPEKVPVLSYVELLTTAAPVAMESHVAFDAGAHPAAPEQVSQVPNRRKDEYS